MEATIDLTQSIENLPLSVRAFNVLRRSGITTWEALLACQEEDFLQMKNMGKKSVSELLELQSAIRNNEISLQVNPETQGNQRLIETLTIGEYLLALKNCEPVENMTYHLQFLNRDQVWKTEVSLEEVTFSKRTYNVLRREKITTIQQLLALPMKEVREFSNMGAKSFDKLLLILQENLQVVAIKQVSKEFQQAHAMLTNWLNVDVDDCGITFDCDYFQQLVIEIFKKLPKDSQMLWNEAEISEAMQAEVVASIYGNQVVADLVKKWIVSFLAEEEQPISQQVLANYLPKSLRKSHYFFQYRDQLILEQKIELVNTNLRIRRPSIYDFIATLPQASYQVALRGRVEGKTLEEVGTEMGITRERVRQIVNKVLRQKPHVWEDEYVTLLQKYAFSKADFLEIFAVPEYVYEYVRMMKGTIEKQMTELTDQAENSELLYDQHLTPAMKQRLYRQLNRQKIHCDGQIIPKDRLAILRFAIQKFAVDEIDFAGFYEAHAQFLAAHELDAETYSYPERSMEAVIVRQDIAVWKYGRKLRYYPMQAYDFAEFLALIDWHNQQNIELSTYRFYCDYPQLMKEYDIHDEYELHSILKKLPAQLLGEHVQLGRMPYIQFGTCDREQQARELLYELAPIAREDLAQAFEDRYGHLALTISGYFSKVLDDYLANGVYRVDELPLTSAEFDHLQANLSEAFYFLDDFKRLFRELLPTADLKKINNQNLRRLGYRQHVNYLFSSQYPTATAFFTNLLVGQSSFSMRAEHSRLWNIQTFAKIITDARKDLTVIERDVNYFEPIWVYEQQGLSKAQLRAYLDEVVAQLDDEYVTIHCLRQKGYDFPFEQFDFTDWTYASLISQHEQMQARRFKNTILLKRQTEPFSLADFAVETIQQFPMIELTDYMNWVWETYQLELNRDRLIEVMKSTPLYYDAVSSMIYPTAHHYESTIAKDFFDFDDNEEIELLDLDDL
ncbi:MAG: DNA-directed RNA polymerase subunit alpha C-terminal domain-containing protein [Culicoidibacterales bacterium]